jgi:hypothetical protein
MRAAGGGTPELQVERLTGIPTGIGPASRRWTPQAQRERAACAYDAIRNEPVRSENLVASHLLKT